MEVHRQRCQACESLDLRDILVRRQGEPTAVYVRCAKCGELVARYLLRGYYHHGKGAESFYKSVGGDASDSGRASLNDFKRVKEEALAGYAIALEALRNEGKDI
jgi:hypothetical protein